MEQNGPMQIPLGTNERHVKIPKQPRIRTVMGDAACIPVVVSEKGESAFRTAGTEDEKQLSRDKDAGCRSDY